MFKYLLITLFTAFSAVAATEDSQVESTTVFSGDSLVKDNYKALNSLEDKYNKLESDYEKYMTCTANNKIYLPTSTNADGDGCIGVQTATVIKVSKKPEWKIFSAATRTGQLVENDVDYDTSDKSQAWGRTKADEICRNTIAGARALTVNDIKYVYDQIPVTSDHYSFGAGVTHMWVFDSYDSVDEYDTTVAKYPYGESPTTCLGWHSNLNTETGFTLEVTGTLPDVYLKPSKLACDQKAIIGCVYN